MRVWEALTKRRTRARIHPAEVAILVLVIMWTEAPAPWNMGAMGLTFAISLTWMASVAVIETRAWLARRRQSRLSWL